MTVAGSEMDLKQLNAWAEENNLSSNEIVNLKRLEIICDTITKVNNKLYETTNQCGDFTINPEKWWAGVLENVWKQPTQEFVNNKSYWKLFPNNQHWVNS